MRVDLIIPQIGESITTVFIAGWLKNPGDHVQEGEAVLEIDSDKASMEIPSPVTGVLVEQLAAEGAEVEIGSVIARLAEGGSAAVQAPAEPSEPAGSEAKAGPAARRGAHEAGVPLAQVDGTGPRGRITSEDVRRGADRQVPARRPRAEPVAPPPRPTAPPPKPVAPPPRPVPLDSAPPVPGGRTEGIERVAMSPLRRTISRRLVASQQSTATLTTFNEIDLSRVKALRRAYQDDFVKKYGIKLGFMSFFVKAVIEGLKEWPSLNTELDGTDVLYKSFYNIGVAVSGPKGLVVPVVRDADRLSFAELELAIAGLARRARDNKLTLADFKDGTFTVSNGGVFGSLMSTPILNPPQVGILGMHSIQERPVAVDGQVVIRPMMYVALSYDHRIVDGREAVSFLVRVKRGVENPERILLEV